MKKLILISGLLLCALGFITVNAAEIVTTKPILTEQPVVVKPIETVKPDVTQQCDVAMELIQQHLPETVGDVEKINSLLQVKPDEWRGRIQIREFFALLKTEFPQVATLPHSPTTGQFESGDAVLKYQLSQGALRYLNRSRMQVSLDTPPAIDEESGMKLVLSLVDTLGLNKDEVNFRTLRSNILKAGITSAKDLPSVKQAIDVERTFFIPRVVNGLKVQQSMMIVGVNNYGELAHFRLKWPVLKMAQNATKTVVKREDMMNRVHQWVVSNDVQCDKAASHFSMTLAYVPVKPATDDEEDAAKDRFTELVFVPKLLVNYLPASENEGGNIEAFDLF